MVTPPMSYLSKRVSKRAKCKGHGKYSHVSSASSGFPNAYRLLDAVRDDASHPLYSLVSVVGDLIEAYEIEHEPKLG